MLRPSCSPSATAGTWSRPPRTRRHGAAPAEEPHRAGAGTGDPGKELRQETPTKRPSLPGEGRPGDKPPKGCTARGGASRAAGVRAGGAAVTDDLTPSPHSRPRVSPAPCPLGWGGGHLLPRPERGEKVDEDRKEGLEPAPPPAFTPARALRSCCFRAGLVQGRPPSHFRFVLRWAGPAHLGALVGGEWRLLSQAIGDSERDAPVCASASLIFFFLLESLRALYSFKGYLLNINCAWQGTGH